MKLFIMSFTFIMYKAKNKFWCNFPKIVFDAKSKRCLPYEYFQFQQLLVQQIQILWNKRNVLHARQVSELYIRAMSNSERNFHGCQFQTQVVSIERIYLKISAYHQWLLKQEVKGVMSFAKCELKCNLIYTWNVVADRALFFIKIFQNWLLLLIFIFIIKCLFKLN